MNVKTLKEGFKYLCTAKAMTEFYEANFKNNLNIRIIITVLLEILF